MATDEEIAREALTLDPTRSSIVMFIGGKGSGKSEAARMLFDAWPYDRVVIDPTGDARPDDAHTIPMAPPFKSQLPEPDPDAEPPQERVTVWARISSRSGTLKADQNAAMTMALYPRRRHVLIWRDEFGLGVTPGTMTDADQDLIMSSRHYNASALLCCPRPIWIPKLAIAQADKLLMFAVANPEDREYVAKNFGVSVPLLERQYQDNRRRGKHAYLLLDRANDALLNCPPLPGIIARGPKA